VWSRGGSSVAVASPQGFYPAFHACEVADNLYDLSNR
jgi:hypothetical protein